MSKRLLITSPTPQFSPSALVQLAILVQQFSSSYIKYFLTDRTHRNKGSDGTPSTTFSLQGSFVSPALFNLAMKELPRQLPEILGLRHRIYEDDTSFWCTTGKAGEPEPTVQHGLDIVLEYARHVCLSFSFEKLEYIVISNALCPSSAKKYSYRELIQLSLAQTPILHVAI